MSGRLAAGLARLSLLAALLGTVIGTRSSGAAENDTAAFLERARKRRIEAEAALAQGRARRLEERKAFTAELQKLYERLARARSGLQKDSTERDRLAGRLRALRAEGARTERRASRLLEQARLAANLPAAPGRASVEAQRAAVRAGLVKRLAALDDSFRLRVRRETVLGRDGRPAEVPVLRVGEAAALAAGEGDLTCGLMRRTPGGSWLISGARLSGEQRAQLRAAAGGALDLLPLDLNGSLVNRPEAEPWTLLGWLAAGGVFIWPILVVGLAGVTLVVERIWFLAAMRSPPSLLREVLAQLADGGGTPLLSDRTPLERVLKAGIAARGLDREACEAGLEAALLAEEPRLERSMTLLAAAAAVAPLLGLLGTVTGMISTFQVISEYGTGNPRLLSGGISEALITTQLGLMVAVPILLAHALISRAVERRQSVLEEAATALLGGSTGGAGGGEPAPAEKESRENTG